MKLGRLLPLCFVAFCLTACLDVDDYGAAWDKTVVDPALAGRWKKISEMDKPGAPVQEWTFALKDGAYEVQGYTNGKKDQDGPLYPVKTFNIGDYKFIASGPEQGMIARYEIDGDHADYFYLNPKKAWEFIHKNYPKTESIYNEVEDPSDNSEPPPLRIAEFDDDVFKILAQIPDTDDYWEPDTELEKVK